MKNFKQQEKPNLNTGESREELLDLIKGLRSKILILQLENELLWESQGSYRGTTLQ